MSYEPVSVKVAGPLACFTRPEMKVERVTYPIMTPSAARGVLEAIFWKPEFSWRIRQIEVLHPIRYFSLLRNEVSTRQSDRSARSWEAEGGGYFADEDRTQRHTLALRDVAYVIRADVRVKPHATENEAAYRDQFSRRLMRGQCFHRPYLGCREFAAWYSKPAPDDRPDEALTSDLGLMLFDLRYAPGGQGPNQPLFKEMRLERGVLRVLAEWYESEAAA